jgi:hypothetical protein
MRAAEMVSRQCLLAEAYRVPVALLVQRVKTDVEDSSEARTTLEGIFSSPTGAEVAELADAPDSGSGALTGVRVQIPASAPSQSPIRPF